MLLIKQQGGCTVAGYEWENDGDAVEVPDGLALELLRIRGGGYSVPDDIDVPPGLDGVPRTRRKGQRGKAVTEPAPPPGAAVTEPAPAGAETSGE